MRKALFYRYLLLLFLVWSCKGGKDNFVYNYESNFEEYLDETYSLSFLNLENKFVFVVPINSCSPCVTKTLEFLTQQKGNPYILGLILADSDNDLIKFESLVSANVNLLFDLNSNYAGYELGIFKPTMVIIHDKKVNVFEELSINNFDKKIGQYHVIESINK